MRLDVETGDGLIAALDGCRSAVYLYHGMGSGAGYADREKRAAERFRDAAEEAGLERIVYLGGVEPEGEASTHLASRLETGRILREGAVATVELRAAMIIGEGSISWRIVRDLSARLPAMALPSWLQNRSMPVLIDDLVVALRAALDDALGPDGVFDVPGAEAVSHRELLRRVAGHLGHDPPMVNVPALFPGLSSLWVALVSNADHSIVRELVDGLRSDLLPSQPSVWDRLSGYEPTPLDRSIQLALGDREAVGDGEPPAPATIERLVDRMPQR